MRKVSLYVKNISSNAVSGYLLQETDTDTPLRIAVRLKIDSSIHNDFMEALDSPYMDVVLDGGVIVGLEEEPSEHPTIEYADNLDDTIIGIVRDKQTIRKQDLYRLIVKKFPLSTKTLQRRLKELSFVVPEIKMNYNKVWYNG